MRASDRENATTPLLSGSRSDDFPGGTFGSDSKREAVRPSITDTQLDRQFSEKKAWVEKEWKSLESSLARYSFSSRVPQAEAFLAASVGETTEILNDLGRMIGLRDRVFVTPEKSEEDGKELANFIANLVELKILKKLGEVKESDVVAKILPVLKKPASEMWVPLDSLDERYRDIQLLMVRLISFREIERPASRSQNSSGLGAGIFSLFGTKRKGNKLFASSSARSFKAIAARENSALLRASLHPPVEVAVYDTIGELRALLPDGRPFL